MTYLAQFLGAVFGGLFSWLAQYFSRKLAMGVTVIATSTAMMLAFYAAIQLLVGGVTATVTNVYFLVGFWAVWPDNAELCIAACLGADVAAFVYRHKLKLMELVTSAS